jgi:acyl carrier protein
MDSKVQDIIEKILLIDRDKINADLSREGVEDWDSMTHLVLISEIEAVFNHSFTDEEVSNIETVGDILSLLDIAK